MAMIVGSIVLGAFTESQQVDDTVDELQKAGFNDIDFAVPGETSSSFDAHSGITGVIRRVFSPNEGDLRGNIASDLVKKGVSDEEAHNYEREFQLGRSIIIVDAPGRQDQALGILRQHGAYDPATRSTTDDTH
ncbi:MAG TPA: hypothetical protein VJ761_24540 [Ktedonobacteraceae bacterium]|nr:hypothetical protein [Ktedonobacteraceae bacterium]